MNHPRIICFGEILWDLLPSARIVGGAPTNVAFHANQIGLQAKIISRVGQDQLGDEIIDFLKDRAISTDLLQVDPVLPTGIVMVQIDHNGHPTYEIKEELAWDHIAFEPRVMDEVRECDAIIYSSLACRNAASRQTLLHLLEVAPFRVLDVNLRAPYYSKELLLALLQKADIVKFSHPELQILQEWLGLSVSTPETMQIVQEQFELDQVIVTLGAKGAFCIDNGEVFQHPGYQVSTQDTIGTGDAFLAAYLCKMLQGASTSQCLDFACAAGAYVATRRGGTPIIYENLILDFIRNHSNRSVS